MFPNNTINFLWEDSQMSDLFLASLSTHMGWASQSQTPIDLLKFLIVWCQLVMHMMRWTLGTLLAGSIRNLFDKFSHRLDSLDHKEIQ